METKPILCLDFDGVLHSYYPSGWKGASVVPDPPVLGAMDFLREAVEHSEVCILSFRSHQEGGVYAMIDWLNNNLTAYFGTTTATYILERISFPREKPPAHIILDDRAMTFNGVWPKMDELLAFKPWHKREISGKIDD